MIFSWDESKYPYVTKVILPKKEVLVRLSTFSTKEEVGEK